MNLFNIFFPNWEDVTYALVRNDEDFGFRPVLEQFEPDCSVMYLAPRASVDVAGGDVRELSDNLDSDDVEIIRQALVEVDRRAAWRRGLALACYMLSCDLAGEFAVSWEPAAEGKAELVGVYELEPVE